MLDTLYPIDTGAMSQYSDGDWLPSCTVRHPGSASDGAGLTSPQTPFMSSLVYPLEDAFPPPEVSFQDPFYSNVEDRGDHHASLLYPPLGFPFHETPLGMKQEPPEERMFRHSPVLSTAGPPPAFNGEMPALEGGRFLSGPPSLIAPDPSMVGRSKRKLEDDSSPDSTSSKRSRRSIGCQQNLELNEEERLLLQLKDQESLPWKDIAIRFQQALGRTHQVPALQMRYKRLREKLRSWTEEDVSAADEAPFPPRCAS